MSYSVPTFETGSFTPTILGSGSNPTVTYNIQSGSYIKVGRCVIVNARIWVNTISGGAGNAMVGGFPFVTTVADGDRGTLTVGFARNFTATTTPSVMWMANDGTARANIYRRASADARDAQSTALTVAECVAGCDLSFTGVYFTA